MSRRTMTEIPAYSEETGRNYPNFEALIDAESNGYVVVAIITDTNKPGKKKESWPWVIGPFGHKKDAQNARARLRTKMKREAKDYPHLRFKTFIRPAWKDARV